MSVLTRLACGTLCRVLPIIPMCVTLVSVCHLIGAASLIGSPIPVCQSGAFWPAICYNEAADQFLVLWVDVTDPNGWQLKARRFDPDLGTPIASEFYISPDPTSVKAVIGVAAYNSTNGEWFVVYQGIVVAGLSGGEDDVLGQRISSDGNKVGSHIILVSKPGYQNSVDAAYDPVNRQFLVVWTERIDGKKQIMGRFFDRTGKPMGPELHLRDSTAPYDSYSPKVAFNPIVGEFLVVWQDYRNYIGTGQDNGYSDIYAQRVQASTRTLVGANIPLYWGGYPYAPNGQDIPICLVCNTSDGSYCVVLQKLTSTEYYRTYALIVDSKGNWLNQGLFAVSWPDFGVPTGAAYIQHADTYLITYEDLTSGHPNVIKGMRFTSEGAAVGDRFDVNTASGGVRSGCLAVRSRDGLCVQLLCTDVGGAVYAQRFTCDCAAIPPSAPKIAYPQADSRVEGPRVRVEWVGQWHDKYEVHINTTNVLHDGSVYDSGEVCSSENDHVSAPLEVSLNYYTFVRIHNKGGWSEWSAPAGAFKLGPNTSPPAAPADVVAVGTNGAVTIALTNPSDRDLAGAIIRSRGDRCPRCPTDGELVAYISGVKCGARSSFRHSPLANGVARYYAIFAFDNGGLASAPACFRAAAETWQVEYHGDVLPTSSVPMWEALDDGGSEFWTHVDPELGVLQITDVSDVPGSKIRWYRNWNAVNSVGETVLERARCNSASVGPSTANITLSDGLRYITFAILPEKVAAKADGASRFDAEYALDGTTWHQYRFVLKGASYACYVDERPIPVFAGTAYPSSANRIVFGVNGSQERQTIDFDYLFYKTTGSTEPPADSDNALSVKGKPDGSLVSLASVLVTACYNGFLYVADPKGLAGIRVVKANHGAAEGKWVDVKGTLYTTAAGERYIAATSVVVR